MREAHDLASWRKDIDAIREEVDFDVLKEFAAVGTCALDFHQALQPRLHHVLNAACIHAVVVDPVRENAHFVNAVHFFGSDLILDGGAVGADNGGVQTSVAVCLGDGDKVFKAVMNGLIELMQGA